MPVVSNHGYKNWNKLYLDAGLNWAGNIGDHNITALLLGKGSRYTMPSDSYNVPSGIVGLVGRVTYNYMNRYMAEYNVGYNGAEQFIEGKRFGFFQHSLLAGSNIRRVSLRMMSLHLSS